MIDAGALLLGNLALDAFFEAWGHKYLKTTGPTDRFDGVFRPSDLSAAALGDVLDGDRPSLSYRAAYRDGRGSGRTFYAPLELARALRDAGMTLVWSDVQHGHPRLAELAAAIGKLVHAQTPISVQCVISPDGQGFPWHHDCTHVLALQIRGSKRWWLGRTPVAFPPFHQQADALEAGRHDLLARLGLRYELPRDDDADEVELVPGDMLYVPPGMWHRAEARGESTHLSILVRPLTFGRVVRAAMTGAALRNQTWRADIQHMSRPELLQFLTVRLAETRRFLAGLTPEQLIADFEMLAASPTLRDIVLERSREVL